MSKSPPPLSQNRTLVTPFPPCDTFSIFTSLPLTNIYLLCSAFLLVAPLRGATSVDRLSAAQSQAPDQRLTQPAFDRQIERVLQNPEYNWRERTAADRASVHSK